jgi:hypothetical protein
MRDALLFLPLRDDDVLRLQPEGVSGTALLLSHAGPGQIAVEALTGYGVMRHPVGRYIATGARHLDRTRPMLNDRRLEGRAEGLEFVAVGVGASTLRIAFERALPVDWYAAVADAGIFAVRLGSAPRICYEGFDTPDEQVVLRTAEDELAVAGSLLGRNGPRFAPVARAVRLHRAVASGWADAEAIDEREAHALLIVGVSAVARSAPPVEESPDSADEPGR